MDKKKTVNVFGVKTTRIEFTEGAHRSANYTANCKPLLQPVFRNYFDLIMKSHEEFVTCSKKDVVNNLNYTTYLYGVCNPFFTVIGTSFKKGDFLEPFFFSSINLTNYQDNSNQLFVSMTINSQRLTHDSVSDLGKNLKPIYDLLEVDIKLNWFCCMISLFFDGFINTPNKVVILWFNEMYYVARPHLNTTREPSDWLAYKTFMLHKCAPYLNGYSLSFGQKTGQFVYKNCEFIHIVCVLLESISEKHTVAIESYGNFLIGSNKRQAFWELIATIQTVLGHSAITHCETSTSVIITQDKVIVWNHGPSFRVEPKVIKLLCTKITMYHQYNIDRDETDGEQAKD